MDFIASVWKVFAHLILAYLLIKHYLLPGLAALRGDDDMHLLTKERTTAAKEKVQPEDKNRLDFSVMMPYKNDGSQESTILDAFVRIYLPQEQYNDVLLRGKVNLENVLRDDDYFEAVLVPEHTGKNIVLRFEAYAKNGKTIAEALGNVPDVDVAVFLECRGRKELYTIKEYFTLTAEEMKKMVK